MYSRSPMKGTKKGGKSGKKGAKKGSKKAITVDNNKENPHKCDCPEHQCVHCNNSPADVRALIDSHIKENGATIIPVMDADPFFAYTIGLTEMGSPELIVMGPTLDVNSAVGILQKCIEAVRDNHNVFKTDVKTKAEIAGVVRYIDNSEGASEDSFRDGLIGCTSVVDDLKEMCTGHLVARYGIDNFTLRQITIEDPGGKLLWHEGYDRKWGWWQQLMNSDAFDEREAAETAELEEPEQVYVVEGEDGPVYIQDAGTVKIDLPAPLKKNDNNE